MMNANILRKVVSILIGLVTLCAGVSTVALFIFLFTIDLIALIFCVVIMAVSSNPIGSAWFIGEVIRKCY